MNQTLKIKTKTISAEIKFPAVLGILLMLIVILLVSAKLVPSTSTKVYLAFAAILALGVVIIVYGRGFEILLEDNGPIKSEPVTKKQEDIKPAAVTKKKVSAVAASNKQTQTRQSTAPMRKVPIPTQSKPVTPAPATMTPDEVQRQVQEKVRAMRNEADSKWESFLGEFENE